jgi:hypothetical protein
MMSIGIVGEYVGRIYAEAKQRPLLLARSILQRRDGPPEIEDISTRTDELAQAE